MIKLKYITPEAWVEAVLADFNQFLLDHAACERKASAMAMSMVAHYPDKPDLVEAMIDLALEEMHHYRQVVKIVHERGLVLVADEKDAYVNQLRKHCRPLKHDYFMDRLILAGVIESRGFERFQLIADYAEDNLIKEFYGAIARSEDKHQTLFIDLACQYFKKEDVLARLEEWLMLEASIIEKLPFRAALH